MSNFAYALPTPLSSPRGSEAPPARQIEIVTSRSQRRARPRAVYAMVAVGSLFVIFMVQLLLSIALSNGAYQISKLTIEERDLGRTQSALKEAEQLNASPQNLAAKAAALNMGPSGNPTFINLTTSHVIGSQDPAIAIAALAPSIKNSLLQNPEAKNFKGDDVANATAAGTGTTTTTTTGTTSGTTTGAGTTTPTDGTAASPVADATPTTGATTASDSLTGNDDTASAPSSTAGTPSVASTPGVLPSPTTH